MSRRLVERFIAYQKARQVAMMVTELAAGWRGAADLVDQALRATTSITCNLSEGTTRPRESADRLRYYRYAWGSAVELEAILDSASDRRLGPADLLSRTRSLAGEVARILTAIVCRPKPPSPTL